MPLVKPLYEESDPEIAELAEFFHKTLGFPPNSVRTMAYRPAIAKAFTELNRAVMANRGRVTSEQKRLVGYLVSSNSGCRYCQAHTALAATRFGTDPARVEQIWEFRSSDLYTAAERAMFEFALAASCVPNAVDEEISAELRRHWDDGEIVEIVGVIALFGYLNRWNDTMATQLEDPAVQVATEHLAGRGHEWQLGKHG